MKPTKRDRQVVLPVFILILNCASICSGQVIDLEMDVTPHIQGLSHLYQRLNAMLHWPVLRGGRNHPLPSSDSQLVKFSKNHSTSKVAGHTYEPNDSRYSPSQFHAQYVRPPSNFGSESSADMMNYVNDALHTSPVDTVGDGGSHGGDFYSASTWDGGNRSPQPSQGEDFSTSSSGSGFYPSSTGEWDVWSPPKAPRRQPPRPRRPLQHYSFGGDTKSQSSYGPYSSGGPSKSYHSHSHSSSKGYKPGPPPGYGNHRRPHPPIKSYSHRPSLSSWEHAFDSHHLDFHDVFDPHHHDAFHGGWGWKKARPVSHSGWGWSPPKDEGWGWSPPVTEGWGWEPKCDPNAPPFKLDSYDDIPPNATFVDGHGRPTLRDDLPPSLVPPPPAVFTVSGNSSALPPNYSERYREKLEIRLNPDGTRSVQREANNRPGDAPTPAAELVNNEHKKGPQPPASPSSMAMNTIQISTSLVDSPFVSAPINGSMNSNKFFERGLAARATAFRSGPPHPFVSQVDVLLTIFNQLEELQTAQNEDEAQKEEEDEATGGWGWGQPPGQSPGQSPLVHDVSGGDESDLATPQVFVTVQRYSTPEPNSSEAGILDSVFNFGPQANRYTFGGLDVVRDEWKMMGTDMASPLNLTSLGATPDEIQSSLNARIRGFVEALRESSGTAYNPVEQMAWSGFEQHQYFIVPDGICQEPIDPPKVGGPTSLSYASGAFNPNSGGCFRARGC